MIAQEWMSILSKWMGVVVVCAASQAISQELETLPAPVPTNSAIADNHENGAILLRGPVHEAFAEQVSAQPTFGLLVPSRPPQAIDEIPPDSKPLGDELVWIPGYWGWEDESQDFVWVTGIWRQLPPGRRWVPGYWNQIDNGYQWVSGFWADGRAEAIEYLPSPPPPIDAIASVPSPSETHFYVPGTWVYREDRYQWRAGYWSASNPNWVWIHDCYVWTPKGCIYRSGYWDYPLAYRGTLFCPIQFRTVYPGLRFQPRYVVNTGLHWLANLFVYPAYRHYYFGDYYASRSSQQNIYPWISYTQSSRHADPFQSFYATQRPNELVQVNKLYQGYLQNERLRPPVTFGATASGTIFNNLPSTGPLAVTTTDALVNSVQSIRNQGWELPFAFERVDNELASRLASGRMPLQELQANRSRVEQSLPKTGNRSEGASSVKVPEIELRLPKLNPQVSGSRPLQAKTPGHSQLNAETYRVLKPEFERERQSNGNAPGRATPTPNLLRPAAPAQARPLPQIPTTQPPVIRQPSSPLRSNPNGPILQGKPQPLQFNPQRVEGRTDSRSNIGTSRAQNRPEAPRAKLGSEIPSRRETKRGKK